MTEANAAKGDEQEKVTRVAELPIADKIRDLPREDYLLDSARHGLAMSGDGTQLCVAGPMSDNGALVDRETFATTIVDDAIVKPYWSINSADGRYCYISGSGEGSVNVISYESKQKVAEFKVGYHPQRVRNGVVRLETYPQAPPKAGFRVRIGRVDAKRAGCRAIGGAELVRCKIVVRDRRGRRVGGGERLLRGRTGFRVPLRLSERGKRLVRRGRAVVIARGTAADGRTDRARLRAKG